MPGPLTLRLAALACPLVLAACGGGGDRHWDVGTKEAGKPPAEIIADASAALSGVKSYHVEGSQTDASGVSYVIADVTAGKDFRLTLSQGAGIEQVVVAGKDTFIRANREFWAAQGGSLPPAAIDALADRWIKAPADTVEEIEGMLEALTPAHLGRCLGLGPGPSTIRNEGQTQLAGRPVVKLTDRGEAPGDSPGSIYVAIDGPPLPLRLVQTGPATPGTPPHPECVDGNDGVTAADVTFSNYGHTPKIIAPSDAVDVADAVRTSGSA